MVPPEGQEDRPPPWVALPDLNVQDPANQGAAEAYIVLNWLPYWQALPIEDKAAYLDRWHASPEWREAIAERYDWDRAEMERDAMEATECVAAHPFPPRKRWWKFWP